MCCPTCGLKGACKRLSPTECICEPTRKGCGQTYDNSTKFAFQPDSLGNNAWASSNFHVFELTKVFRQDNRTFVDHLNKIRLGTCDEDTEAFINTAARPLQLAAADIKPTKLYPLNRNVDYENNQHYNALNTEAITFSAFDGHGGPNGVCWALDGGWEMNAAEAVLTIHPPPPPPIALPSCMHGCIPYHRSETAAADAAGLPGQGVD